jgi:phosphohistidine phosphatase SixA
MRLLLAIFALLSLSWFALAQDPEPQPVAPVTVILVRHAETTGDTSGGGSRDPGLSVEGAARAMRLAKLFAHAGVTHVFSSEFKRTQLTAGPLAKLAGKEIETVSARDTESQLEKLRALPAGSVAVVCGHSNTVPGMATELGGKLSRLEQHPQYGGMLPHDDYSRIYVVTLPGANGAAPRALELSY